MLGGLAQQHRTAEAAHAPRHQQDQPPQQAPRPKEQPKAEMLPRVEASERAPETKRNEERPRPRAEERRREPETHKRPPQPAKSPEDLKAVLARLSQGGEAKGIKSVAPDKSPLRSALADVLKQVEPAKTDTPPPPPKPAPAPVETKDDLAKLAAEAEAAFEALESTHRASNADDPLAPKKIEKLFKSSGGERSPFAS